MTDIVARLREPLLPAAKCRELRRAAADEIEQLRSTLALQQRSYEREREIDEEEIERLRTENAALKREAYTWWQLAVSAPQDERKRCAALCKAQADRWADDRARYAAIECAKAIEAQVPT